MTIPFANVIAPGEAIYLVYLVILGRMLLEIYIVDTPK